jgi:hypothetical protein
MMRFAGPIPTSEQSICWHFETDNRCCKVENFHHRKEKDKRKKMQSNLTNERVTLQWTNFVIRPWYVQYITRVTTGWSNGSSEIWSNIVGITTQAEYVDCFMPLTSHFISLSASTWANKCTNLLKHIKGIVLKKHTINNWQWHSRKQITSPHLL